MSEISWISNSEMRLVAVLLMILVNQFIASIDDGVLKFVCDILKAFSLSGFKYFLVQCGW